MSLALTQIGATSGLAAYTASAAHAVLGRKLASSIDPTQSQTLRAVAPVADEVRLRNRIRGEVLTDRGTTDIALNKLTPQTRIATEVSVDAETAWRARQVRERATGNVVDMRV